MFCSNKFYSNPPTPRVWVDEPTEIPIVTIYYRILE